MNATHLEYNSLPFIAFRGDFFNIDSDKDKCSKYCADLLQIHNPCRKSYSLVAFIQKCSFANNLKQCGSFFN